VGLLIFQLPITEVSSAILICDRPCVTEDMINKLSINNTHTNLLHYKLIKRNLNFNEWMHKLKKLKTKSCVRLIHSLAV
jgi:hypothetical protein